MIEKMRVFIKGIHKKAAKLVIKKIIKSETLPQLEIFSKFKINNNYSKEALKGPSKPQKRTNLIK